jgi:hypothetical protein
MLALDIFRLFGGVVDDLLPVADVLSRLATSKDAYDNPSSTAFVLRLLQAECGEREDEDFAPTILRMIESSGRPLTMARAEEMVVVADEIWSYAYGDGKLSRIEQGENLEFMMHSVGGEDTPWDEVVVQLRSWVKEQPDCTHNDLETHMEYLLEDRKDAHLRVYRRQRVHHPDPWITPMGMGNFIPRQYPWNHPMFMPRRD